ncbi:MAG TPA: bifunctional precorrin-2 dehydrogenase/sirohydrochlorin ferrochelatase [Tepidisphaeraceae bacterium]|nr:bifunctional precorrin-2 dehydrogenase/sirohydrochlorin ferrochelatase [Tepidisphaeraceae bacterium]
MSHLYPIFLDVSQRRVVIVGGGAVAARKAAGILAAGAKSVRAVAPKFVREFPKEFQKKLANFEPADLDGAELVFAATDSAVVNDAVVAEARKRGIWVQRGDEQEDEPGDFIIPAILRCGPITVAVSASGSPALAAGLRDRLAGGVTDEWVKLAEAMKQLRPKIKSSGLPISRRREIFRALATPDAAVALESGGMHGLRKWLRGKFADLPEFQSEAGGVG